MSGQRITIKDKVLNVPDNPVIPFIEGDGTGPDIWAASKKVFDASVEKAYNGKRKIEWKEVLAGQKAFDETGEWLPQATLDRKSTRLNSSHVAISYAVFCLKKKK